MAPISDGLSSLFAAAATGGAADARLNPPTPTMVLGAILSLNQHVLNFTDPEQRFMQLPLSDSGVDAQPAKGSFIPVFELVLGTITYLVSCQFVDLNHSF